jgi:nitroreductase
MAPINADALIGQLEWRYATKRFDPTKKIPSAIWSALEASLVLSPSSFGLQPWRFLVVEDNPTREKLKPLSWEQSQIVDASHMVVLAAKKDLSKDDVHRFVKRMTEVRGIPESAIAQYRDMMLGFVENTQATINEWAAKQVYIAMGVLLTSAALLGIDACPMEGIDPAKYDEILGLPNEGYRTLAVVTLGYRHTEDNYSGAKKVRFSPAEVVVHR